MDGRLFNGCCLVGALLASLVTADSIAAQSVIYVDARHEHFSDGTTWRTAYKTLHEALAAADHGDQIWMAAGSYLASEGTTNRSRSFRIEHDIEVYGGFGGYEAHPDERDPVHGPTILDGLIEMSPEESVTGVNVYHVVQIDAPGRVVLDGLVIRGGIADSTVSGRDTLGAGVYVVATDCEIRSCTFTGNVASIGAGLYCRFGDCVIRDSVFGDNLATAGGGAVHVEDGYLEITASEFTGNAGGTGGAVHVANGNLDISTSELAMNAADAGGAIHVLDGDLSLVRCDLFENHATIGGGVWVRGSRFTSMRCAFVGNTADSAAAITIDQAEGTPPGSVLIRECTLVGNAGAIHLRPIEASIATSRFERNVATQAGGTGVVIAEDNALIVDRCAFDDNLGGSLICRLGHSGLGVSVLDSRFRRNPQGIDVSSANEVIVRRCLFEENGGGASGGAARLQESNEVEVADCDFRRNVGVAGGALSLSAATILVTRCRFEQNTSQFVGGAITVAAQFATLESSSFTHNSTSWWGGGALVSGNATAVNCLFRGNRADLAGGGMAFLGSECDIGHVINCTIAENCGSGVSARDMHVGVWNSIVWRNGPHQLFIDTDDGPPPPPGSREAGWEGFTVKWSDIEGGWIGDGNIDDDPLFVQPGMGDFRLSLGSPAIDAGDNGLLPAGLAVDLAGQARIQNDIVDMGAFEGAFSQQPDVSSSYGEVGPGSFAVVGDVGCGQGFSELGAGNYVLFHNEGSDQTATIEITQQPDSPNSPAGGYSEVATVMAVDVSMPPGTYNQLVTVAFGADDLAGNDPLDLDLTTYDPASDDWVLAAASNARVHPGSDGPLGERTVTTGEVFALVGELGDYGVYWNPQMGSGLVWARVDHDGEFAVGDIICYGDIAPSERPDDKVTADDLVALLAAWGQPSGVADIHPDRGDGLVDVNDLLRLLASWGACPP